MKLSTTHSRTERNRTAPSPARAASERFVEHAKKGGRSSDDSLGRGMELAITILVFLGIGYLVDRWLGLFPVFTIGLVLFAAVGSFVQMKYTYDAHMEKLEAERAARLNQHRAPAVRDADSPHVSPERAS